jgi:hypothetical protein
MQCLEYSTDLFVSRGEIMLYISRKFTPNTERKNLKPEQ